MKYDTREIPLDEIEVTDRLRPVDNETVEALAADIAARGLRTPIEVAESSNGALPYRLIAGAHRNAACVRLGLARIAARIVSGSELELRRDEIMENIGRNELSTLDEARFLHQLKEVEQALIGATRGGDRRSSQAAENQTLTIRVWFQHMAKMRRRSAKTIEDYVRLGRRLSDDTAARLRGTPFADRYGELKALGELGAQIQKAVTDQLLAEKNAAPTVKSAIARIQGRPEPEGEAGDKAFKRLLDAWNRAPTAARQRFLNQVKREARA